MISVWPAVLFYCCWAFVVFCLYSIIKYDRMHRKQVQGHSIIYAYRRAHKCWMLHGYTVGPAARSNGTIAYPYTFDIASHGHMYLYYLREAKKKYVIIAHDAKCAVYSIFRILWVWYRTMIFFLLFLNVNYNRARKYYIVIKKYARYVRITMVKS